MGYAVTQFVEELYEYYKAKIVDLIPNGVIGIIH
jgi:hypothetical protein